MSSSTRRGSIRSRLVVLVLAVTLPLTGLGAYVIWSEARLTKATADRAILERAQITATGIGQFFQDVEFTLTGIADRPQIRALAEGACQGFVSEANAVFLQFTNVFVVRADGSVVCSALDLPTPPTSAVGAPWYEDALAADGFAVGRPQYGRISDEWISVLSYPILDDQGERTGFIGASVSLQRFRELLPTATLPEGGIVTLAHVDGTVVVRSDSEVWTADTLPRVEGGSDHVSNVRGLQRATGVDGVDRIWGYHTVPRSDWIVYAGVPLTWAYSPLAEQAVLTTGGVVFLTLLLTLLAVRLYREIGGSLDHLVSGVEAAASGEVDALPTEGPEEIVKVAQAFNWTLMKRARAEMEHRRSTRRYASVLRNSVFGIYMSSEEGVILEANPALARMLGYEDPETLRGMNMQTFYADPRQRERLITQSRHSEQVVVEVEWMRRDGSPLYARLFVTTVREERGERVYEAIVEDRTERIALEDQLRQSQKLEALGRLAGGVAHDFNNRLTVIQGQAGLLDLSLDQDDERREHVDAILDSAANAARLTARLLTFGRKQIAQPRDLDLNAVIEHVAKVLRQVVGEDVRLTLELAPDLPQIRADQAQLEQLLLNLGTNARDAMPRGGDFVVSTRHETNGRDAECVVLEVSDTGVGMTEGVRQRLFEPFFTTKPEGKGTGLGLSTVYGIVRQSRGEIEVDSTPGEGTTFEIRFPARTLAHT